MRIKILQKLDHHGSLHAGDIIEMDDFQAVQLVAFGVAEAADVLPPQEPPKATGKPPKAADKP